MDSSVPNLAAPTMVIGAGQPEFIPITAAVVTHPGYSQRVPNSRVLRFRPNDEERARIAAGEDVYVSLLTFGEPMQGVIVTAGAAEMAAIYGVPTT